MHIFSILHRNGDGIAIIPTHPDTAAARETMIVLVLVRSWRLLQTRTNPLYFQPSWRCKETSREPKTPFPLKIFLIAIWEYSIAFFDRERRVFNSIWKKQRYCYVKCNYGCKHRSPLNVFVRRFDEQSLKPVYWFSRSMGQSEIQKRPERFFINIFTSQKRKLLYSALLKQ